MTLLLYRNETPNPAVLVPCPTLRATRGEKPRDLGRVQENKIHESGSFSALVYQFI